MNSRRDGLAVIPLGFLGVMVVWPVVAILLRSLAGVGPAEVAEVLTRPSVLRILRFTFTQAALSVLLTLAVGLPIAHALSRYEFRGRSFIRAATVVPFVLPTVVVAAAFDALFDLMGFQLEESMAAILMAHVFFNVAVVVRMVGGYWQGMEGLTLQAASTLGAGPWQAFRRVTLPRLVPIISGASLIVFLFSFTSFGVILILGGTTRGTLETEIRRYTIFRGELDVAAVLALAQMLVVGVLALLAANAQRKLTSPETANVSRPRIAPSTLGQRLHLFVIVSLVGVVVLGPIASLMWSSVSTEGGLTLVHYRSLFDSVSLLPVSPIDALVRSVVIAVVAALIAVAVGLVAGRVITNKGPLASVVETSALIPLGVSAVTLGFGYLVAFKALDFRSSIWIVPLAHAVVGLPFVLASLLPTWRGLQSDLVMAAQTLGASPSRTFRLVEWPLISSALRVGAGFAAAVSLGEFGATSFISRSSETFTAPMAIFRLLSQPGELIRGQAMALSVVVGALVAVLASLMERRRGEGAVLL